MSSISNKMKIRLAGAAVAAAMAVSSFSASATALLLRDGANNVVSSPYVFPAGTFSGTFSSGDPVNPASPSGAIAGADNSAATLDAFTDTINFVVGGPTGSFFTLTSGLTLSGAGDINFTSVLLDSTPFLLVSTGTGLPEYQFLGANIAAGTHTLTFSGTTNGTPTAPASYSGTFNLEVAAVPEAATWGMMVLGFGIMGAGIRSRKRSMVLA